MEVDIYGNIWKYMEISGNIWKYLEIYGNIWKYMENYGNIWKSIGNPRSENRWKIPNVCLNFWEAVFGHVANLFTWLV